MGGNALNSGASVCVCDKHQIMFLQAPGVLCYLAFQLPWQITHLEA